MNSYIVTTTDSTLQAIPHRQSSVLPPNTLKMYNRQKNENQIKYKTAKHLKRSLTNARNLFYQLDINPDQCMHITLTSAADLTYNEFYYYVNLFLKKLKYRFPAIKFITRTEFNEVGLCPHLHSIVIFNDGIPEYFNVNYVQSLWRLGRISCTPINDLYHLITYICKYQETHDLLDTSGFCKLTKYPYGVRPISFSKNIPKKDIKTFTINQDKYHQLIESFKEQHENNSPIVETFQHNYIDKNTGELKTCIDSLFYYYKEKAK